MAIPPNLGPLLQKVYRRLYTRYGPQGWWPGDGPFDVVVGAILTQAAAWTNVERGIRNMKEADCWSWLAIYECPVENLAEIIRSCGYFNSKARKLKAVVDHLARYDDDTDRWRTREAKELRAELLGVYGIGPETADDIVLYVADLPSFVMDTYTIRLVDRIGIAPKRKRYADYQALFEDNLTRDAQMFNEYHALMDTHAKDICRKRNPACPECVLRDMCKLGRAQED